MEIKKFTEYTKDMDTINEDGDGGGGAGVASANAGNVSGMGNVVAAQPSSVAGATVTGDGTTGSGDVGTPIGVYTNPYQNSNYGNVLNKKTNKPKKYKSKETSVKVDKFLNDLRKRVKSKSRGNNQEKMMSFDNYTKSQMDKVTKVDK